jgi:hypothetical protein
MYGGNPVFDFLKAQKNNITFGLCVVLMIVSFTIVVKPGTMSSPGLLYANAVFTLLAVSTIFVANILTRVN